MVPDNFKKYELSKYAQVRRSLNATVDSFIFTKIDSRRTSYVHVKHLLCKLLKGKGEQGKYLLSDRMRTFDNFLGPSGALVAIPTYY